MSFPLPLSSYLTAFTRGGQICCGVMENTCSHYLCLFLLSLSTSPSLPVEASRERLRLVSVSSSEIRPAYGTPDTGRECKNLAIARNELDVSWLSDICGEKEGDDHCWVGLREARKNVWKWLNSDKITSLPVLTWEDTVYQKYSSDVLRCGTVQGDKLHGSKCDKSLKALCQRNYLWLVMEEKTWEEALQHCRALPKNADLLSFHDEEELSFTKVELAWTQVEEVWIGLRWLARRWLWMDQAASGNISLPKCPANGTHCGILSRKGLLARNCMEKRRFFCLREAQP